MKLIEMLVGSALRTAGASIALLTTSPTYPPPSRKLTKGAFIVKSVPAPKAGRPGNSPGRNKSFGTAYELASTVGS